MRILHRNAQGFLSWPVEGSVTVETRNGLQIRAQRRKLMRLHVNFLWSDADRPNGPVRAYVTVESRNGLQIRFQRRKPVQNHVDLQCNGLLMPPC